MKPFSPQRRRRDIFVEISHPNFTSPIGVTYSDAPKMPLLRSLDSICHRFYNYAAPTVLPKPQPPNP